MKVDTEYIGDLIILNYVPSGKAEWINEKIDEKGFVSIKNAHFYFQREDIKEQEYDELSDSTSVQFIIARLKDEYYEIPAHVFRTSSNILILKDKEISKKRFSIIVANNLFRAIEDTIQEQVVIGEGGNKSIPYMEFINLVDSCPSKTELFLYTRKRISNLLNDYFDNVKDYGKLYEKHLTRQNKRTTIENTLESVAEYEAEKYSFILARLQKMIQNEDSYAENIWRNEIIQIITLIYPKYVAAVKELCIKGTVREKAENRFIDIALFDVNGNIDVIEIKKPSDTIPLLSSGKYRDNYVPSKDLTGAIMQVEKYIYHLKRMGKEGEKLLTTQIYKKRKCDSVEANMKVRITNPKGMVIMGRSVNLSDEQKNDFEIIRRKYANIVDIITYDDLIYRLECLIRKFAQTNNPNHAELSISIDKLELE